MRKFSNLILIFTLVMCVIAIPLGIANVCMAFRLGLVFDMVGSLFMLTLFIAFTGYELHEYHISRHSNNMSEAKQTMTSDDVSLRK